MKPLGALGRSGDTSLEAMVVAHTCDPRVLWAEAGECFEFEPSLCYWSARTWGAESYLFVLNRLDPRVAREETQRETEWCQDVSNSSLAVSFPL